MGIPAHGRQEGQPGRGYPRSPPQLCLLPGPRGLFDMHSRSGALYKTVICTAAPGRETETASPLPGRARPCSQHQRPGRIRCAHRPQAAASGLPPRPCWKFLPSSAGNARLRASPRPHRPLPPALSAQLPCASHSAPASPPRRWRICLEGPPLSSSKDGAGGSRWSSPSLPSRPPCRERAGQGSGEWEGGVAGGQRMAGTPEQGLHPSSGRYFPAWDPIPVCCQWGSAPTPGAGVRTQ